LELIFGSTIVLNIGLEDCQIRKSTDVELYLVLTNLTKVAELNFNLIVVVRKRCDTIRKVI